MRGMLTFFLVGFRSGFWEGALLGLLLPLAWGVWEEVIPAFGGTADFFGKCLVFLFGFGISLMMTVILGGILARYYGGNLTRKAVNSLVWGRTLSLVAKGVLIFLVFNLLVFLLSPKNVFYLSEAVGGSSGSGFVLLRDNGDEGASSEKRRDAACPLAGA